MHDGKEGYECIAVAAEGFMSTGAYRGRTKYSLLRGRALTTGNSSLALHTNSVLLASVHNFVSTERVPERSPTQEQRQSRSVDKVQV